MHRPPHSCIASPVQNENENDRKGKALACLLHNSQKKWCELHFAPFPLHMNDDRNRISSEWYEDIVRMHINEPWRLVSMIVLQAVVLVDTWHGGPGLVISSIALSSTVHAVRFLIHNNDGRDA